MAMTSGIHLPNYFYSSYPACERLVPPANGQPINNETACGSVVQFACDDCYTLNGSSHLKCTDVQQWNGTEPTCEPKPGE